MPNPARMADIIGLAHSVETRDSTVGAEEGADGAGPGNPGHHPPVDVL
jgi:hypothetical protein